MTEPRANVAGALSVWAPHSSGVQVETAEGVRALEPGARGYYHLRYPPLANGTRYRLRLDGAPGLPDPRSAYQPDGVHGPSQVVDHSAFGWTDRAFVPVPLDKGIIYELHIGTFTPGGTFESAIERLDQLVELGVTHLEIMPVAEFPGERGWGYDGVDLFAPYHNYGTPEDLKRLVDASHARGLAVLLDVVYNHLGPDGNYLSRFGPYFSTDYTTPWGAAINLDGPGSDEVRRFFCDNALGWLELYHMDGLRLDAVHAFLDRSAQPFLEQLSREVAVLAQRLGRSKVLIAESDLNDPRLVQRLEAGGCGCDAQWSDDFHHSLHALLTRERNGYYGDFGELSDLRDALLSGFVYAGRYSTFRRRSQGRSLGGVPLSRLVGYLQNHDQVGNRARGDRIGGSLSAEQLELAAALVLTGPFVPLLFQGEEWNASSPFRYFTDHQHPELARAVTVGRQRECVARGERLESIPDPQALETFQASKLDWYEIVLPEHRALLDWYSTLIRLRRSEPDLTGPESPQVNIDAGGRWLTSQRGRVLVAANFSPGPLGLPAAAGSRLLLGSRGAEVSSGVLTLPGWGVGILRVPS